MTCSNTNPAAAQAFALVYARIAAATAPIFYRHPAPVAAAFFHMASAAVRMGRVDALFKRGGVQRRRGAGPLMGSHSLWRSKSPALRTLSATNIAEATGVP
jgi:hypothetical protein